LLALSLAPIAASGDGLPDGFVYLRHIDKTIVQDIRYATANNFTGTRVPGYLAGECVLLRETAVELKKVQDELRKRNLSLKVYDCYRPQRAVQSFVDWVRSPTATGLKRFFPRTTRADLIREGYIAPISGHARGTAVDLTLVELPHKATPHVDPGREYGPCNASQDQREPDESLDMGTGYDCFDVMGGVSPLERYQAHASAGQVNGEPPSAPLSLGIAPDEVSKEQRARRRQLADVMLAHGFKGITAEWWHFSYTKTARPVTAHDFLITAPH
jgi:D-alanyl-D-alanine dipeptidase